MRLRFLSHFCFALLVSSTIALACNIPVFRYALERWRPDKLELFVFHAGQLSEDLVEETGRFQAAERATEGSPNSGQPSPIRANVPNTTHNWQAQLNSLMEQSANLDINLVDVTQPLSGSAAEVWAQLGTSQLPDSPYAALRGKHARGPFTCWSGPLTDTRTLVTSPVREEVARRILAGHSIVWLTILSEDPHKNRPILDMLNAECKRLGSEIELPEGIGLPGSELYSEVPLLLKFSTLEVERTDAREQVLIEIGKGFQPDAFDKGEPLVIPIFGRGRALEVLPGSRIGPALIEDITMFLCAACSCQVKDQNPGFDLLIAVDWEQELYGETGAAAPPADSIRPGERIGAGQGRAPVLLSIPPGRSKN